MEPGQPQYYSDAITAFRKALKFNPKFEQCYYDLGMLLAKFGQKNTALKCLGTAIKINPQFALAHCDYGELLGLDNSALAAFDRALEIDSKFARAHYGRGKIFAELEKHDDALAAFDAALKIDPQFALAHHGRGDVFYVRKQLTEAEHAYLAALTINHDLPIAQDRFRQITGVSYKDYNAQRGELSVQLAAVAGEIGMLRNGQKHSAIQMNSNAAESQLLQIILDYADWPEESKKEEPRTVAIK